MCCEKVWISRKPDRNLTPPAQYISNTSLYDFVTISYISRKNFDSNNPHRSFQRCFQHTHYDEMSWKIGPMEQFPRMQYKDKEEGAKRRIEMATGWLQGHRASEFSEGCVQYIIPIYRGAPLCPTCRIIGTIVYGFSGISLFALSSRALCCQRHHRDDHRAILPQFMGFSRPTRPFFLDFPLDARLDALLRREKIRWVIRFVRVCFFFCFRKCVALFFVNYARRLDYVCEIFTGIVWLRFLWLRALGYSIWAKRICFPWSNWMAFVDMDCITLYK